MSTRILTTRVHLPNGAHVELHLDNGCELNIITRPVVDMLLKIGEIIVNEPHQAFVEWVFKDREKYCDGAWCRIMYAHHSCITLGRSWLE